MKLDPHEKAVFCQAVEITDLEQRRLFLVQACGSDQILRERVEKLLALSPSAGNFFEECSPALAPKAGDADQVLAAAESAVESELSERQRIGPYKLLQKLGEGGCGVVYMAEQDHTGMSFEGEGKHEPVLAELEQARKIIETGFEDGLKHGRWDRGLWFDWVFARVLLREASELRRTKLGSAQ